MGSACKHFAVYSRLKTSTRVCHHILKACGITCWDMVKQKLKEHTHRPVKYFMYCVYNGKCLLILLFLNCTVYGPGNDCVALQAGNADTFFESKFWDMLTIEDCTSRLPFICQASMSLILFASK